MPDRSVALAPGHTGGCDSDVCCRAVSWREVPSLHTWIAVDFDRCPRYVRYEVLGFGAADGAPAVRVGVEQLCRDGSKIMLSLGIAR
jgi:hypothetical protein